MAQFKVFIALLVFLPIFNSYCVNDKENYRPLKSELDNFLNKKPALLDKPLEEHAEVFFPSGSESIGNIKNYSTADRLFEIKAENRNIWSTAMSLAIPTGVLVQGVLAWDWGKNKKKFGFGKEGWFDATSYSGGADKTGHMMSHFIQKRFYTWLFYQLGHDKQNAQLFGLLGAGLTGLMIELGDGISRFRFSWEDILMDTIGISLGYVLDQFPKIDNLIGLRWEYFPSKHFFTGKNKDKFDFMSDYNGQKFYLTLKAQGIPVLREKWYTRYLTADIGYFTRGYKPDFSPDKIRNRNNSQWWSYGIGLNLSALINDVAPKNTFTRLLSSITKYWIPPGIVYSNPSNISRGKIDFK